MKLNHQTVAAYAALFIALGGTATAALHLGRGSVGSREIRNHSVRPVDLSSTARPLTEKRLRDVVEQVITDPASGIQIHVSGEKGDPGPAGPAGPAGPQGSPGVFGVAVRESDSSDVGVGYANATADCQPGETVLGGGEAFVASGDAGAVVTRSLPVTAGDEQGWQAEMHNAGPGTGHVHVYAVCARVG